MTLVVRTMIVAAAALAATTASSGAPAVATMLPRFERVLMLEKTSATSANVSVGDLNGDGSADIVLAKGRHWPLHSRVLLNDGHGNFPTAHDLGDAPLRSYSAKLADIDGDKDTDVVLSSDRPDRKLVFLNDGSGHFEASSDYGDSNWPTRNAEVADLNGDTLPDIVVANRSTGKNGANFVCLNRGHGKFDANCIAFASEPATTIAAADFNRDGAIDLAVPFRDGGQSYVYVNDGRAGFQQRLAFGPPDAHFRVAATADMNGDGRADIVAIDEQRGAFVFLANETGFAIGASIGSHTATPYALALSDLNKDGKADAVVGHVEAQSIVYFNDGSGRSFTPVLFGDAKGTVYGFAVTDLDKDGASDIAVARSDAPNVVYFGSSSR